MSADLPPLAAPAPIYKAPWAPWPFSWTGFLIGANAGAGWNHGNLNDSFDLFSGVDGGQIGANYQINNFVPALRGTSTGSRTTTILGTEQQ
jgi:outer membrane immunogenic protein